mgnify:CR=1 FL=1
MQLKEDDVVLCTVKSIEGTTVFLEIEGNGAGSMVMSEVAAGRIRNLREYVFPNKKVVCKVLKISPNNIQLSLRRVSSKEKEEVMDLHKKQQTLNSILKTINSQPQILIDKIKEKYDIRTFLDEARENPKILHSILPKEEADKLEKILSEKKEKEKSAKKIIVLRSDSSEGINDIKSVLSLNNKNIEISYLGSSQFMLTTSAKDFKVANNSLTQAIEEIKQKAKEKKIFFELKEK